MKVDWASTTVVKPSCAVVSTSRSSGSSPRLKELLAAPVSELVLGPVLTSTLLLVDMRLVT